MIWYDEDDWLIKVIFQCTGSVFPRAALFAIPSAALAIVLRWLHERQPELIEDTGLLDITESILWSGMTAAIGTLIGFRIRQALGRFWEGTGLLHQMRGEWFESAACLVTFSRQAKLTKPAEVAEFRHTLVRLMSLCHGSALDEIKAEPNENFEAIDTGGLDIGILRYLQDCKDTHKFNRVEVILHMIQVLVTQGLDDGVLKVAPPILSRVYQTLSRGLVNLLNAKKITDVKFPFPFTQLITVLLFVYSIFTPMMFTVAVESEIFAAVLTFFPVFAMFSLDFAAIQLEMPFGDDANDLPLDHFQTEMNTSLLMLLHENSDLKPCLRKGCERSFTYMKDHVHRIGELMHSLHLMHQDEQVLAQESAAVDVPEPPKQKAPPSPPTAPTSALPVTSAPAAVAAFSAACPLAAPSKEEPEGCAAEGPSSPARGAFMDTITQLTGLSVPPQSATPTSQQALLTASDFDSLGKGIDKTMKDLAIQLQSWKHQSSLEATALSEVLTINCEAITGLSQSIPQMTDSIGKLNTLGPTKELCEALVQWMQHSDRQSADLLDRLARNSEVVATFTETMLDMNRSSLGQKERMPASSQKKPAKDADDALYTWMKKADDKWANMLQALNRNTDAVAGLIDARQAAGYDPLSPTPIRVTGITDRSGGGGGGGCCMPNRSNQMQLL